jgi:hypothetical protein
MAAPLPLQSLELLGREIKALERLHNKRSFASQAQFCRGGVFYFGKWRQWGARSS